MVTRAEWTNALPSVGSTAITVGVRRDFGAITDYFPVQDSPNGSAGGWGWNYDSYKHNPKKRLTWYDRYLERRYWEMRRLANEEAKTVPPEERHGALIPGTVSADVVLIDRYTTDFYERYLRNRKYYYGSNTERE